MADELFDPFGDHLTAGYLRNTLALPDKEALRSFELAAFSEYIEPALRFLWKQSLITYDHIKRVHQILFQAVYPWAGQDRLLTAPDIAIAKAGISTMFAHPKDINRASTYAITRGQDVAYLRAHPGEVYCYLAHAHPFLDGNGRTILTIHDELCRRAGFHVAWHEIGTSEFLTTLTGDLLDPRGNRMDGLVKRHLVQGKLSIKASASKLKENFGR